MGGPSGHRAGGRKGWRVSFEASLQNKHLCLLGTMLTGVALGEQLLEIGGMSTSHTPIKQVQEMPGPHCH